MAVKLLVLIVAKKTIIRKPYDGRENLFNGEIVMSLVYRDMTFCRFSDCADFDKCSRRLTESVKQAAELLRCRLVSLRNSPNVLLPRNRRKRGKIESEIGDDGINIKTRRKQNARWAFK